MFAVPDQNEVTHVIKGSFDIGGQYHFTMETQQCVCVPTEDGMDVYPSTQWMDLSQFGIAQALTRPENRFVLYIVSVTGLCMVKILHHTALKVFPCTDICCPTLLESKSILFMITYLFIMST
jgi:hypothetical protein